MEWLDMIEAAIEAGGAVLLFDAVVLAGFALLLLGVLFFLLALRGIWRWLARHTWRDVVASAERKALR
jgi:hypothetical protein